MSTLKDEMELLIAVGVWAATADGTIDKVETATVLSHIVNSTEEEIDEEAVTEEIVYWVSEFSDDYDHAEQMLKGKIEGARNISIIGDDLIDIAQRVIAADEALSEQEDVAMEKLHSWLR